MEGPRYIEMDGEALDAIQRIMSKLDDSNLGSVVSRAIGLMETVMPYTKNGILRVEDLSRADFTIDPLEGAIDIIVDEPGWTGPDRKEAA